jgi:hypothetical protein
VATNGNGTSKGLDAEFKTGTCTKAVREGVFREGIERHRVKNNLSTTLATTGQNTSFKDEKLEQSTEVIS